MQRITLFLASLFFTLFAIAAPPICEPGCVQPPPTQPPAGAIPINASGNIYFQNMVAGPNLFSVTTTKPSFIKVAWGQTPDSKNTRIDATMTGPGGSWKAAGNQAGGYIASGTSSNVTVPAGVYLVTLTLERASRQTISPQITVPR